jgi:uncharacterized membrane protein YfcA
MELGAVKILIDGLTGLPSYRRGNVDLPLVSCVPEGAIPASLAGSVLGTLVPVLWLRRILCTILLATNARVPRAPAIH